MKKIEIAKFVKNVEKKQGQVWYWKFENVWKIQVRYSDYAWFVCIIDKVDEYWRIYEEDIQGINWICYTKRCLYNAICEYFEL